MHGWGEINGFRSDACARLVCPHVCTELPRPHCAELPHGGESRQSGLPADSSSRKSQFHSSLFLAVYKSAGCGCTTHHRLSPEVVSRWQGRRGGRTNPKASLC